MKIRSVGELQDHLDAQFSVRKREITTLGFLIDSAGRTHQEDVLLRSAYPILYAHWEGYIKYSAVAYLEFVARKSVPLEDLSNSMAAVAARPHIKTASLAYKIRPHIEIVELFFRYRGSRIPMPTDDAIDTQSNLSFEVLRDIIETIGIDFDAYWETKAHLIDYQLLKTRNEIAHGALIPIEMSEYRQLQSFVLESLERFKIAVLNAAALNRHLRAT